MSTNGVFFGKTPFFAHSYALSGAATNRGIIVIVPFAELFSDRIHMREEEQHPRYLMFKLCLKNTSECFYFFKEKKRGVKKKYW